MISDILIKQLEYINENRGIIITGTKFNFKCNKCDHTWGVYLAAYGNLPRSWNICISCAKRKEDETKKYLESLSVRRL
ncbi:hypothetical protein HN419_00005 [Candidatus Woesearchaeota archaeon]|nr:hypothetical protein [Candidatus Woesearchaeota archaeon]MBT6050296.1 hypothetical protein [Candidatus Scalindua sp.]